ncbi:MAG: HAD family hydrolase [Candidatus Cloacimonetes bacterium]|nr:HAD family hydrolase [Candidatus Cloacimonadota bacterium]
MIAKSIKRAVFLDRDGVISPDEFGYISNPDEYSLYPYTGQALRILQELGFLLFVVSNQSGIARGYFSVEALDSVFVRMRDLIAAEGVSLSGIFYSPYHIEGSVPPYNIDHEDRKPGIGMYKKARELYNFDTGKSWMIGDRNTDILFGRNAGLKTMLLLSGNGQKVFLEEGCTNNLKADFICENLLTAANLIAKFGL